MRLLRDRCRGDAPVPGFWIATAGGKTWGRECWIEAMDVAIWEAAWRAVL